MNKLRIFTLLLACSLSLGMASAQKEDSVIVYNDKRPLIYEDAWDLWPYVFLNENGEPDGYNIDLLKMILKELDIPYIIRLRPTLEAQRDLKEHKSDLMLRMDADFARNNSSYGKVIVQIFTHSLVKPKTQTVKANYGRDLADYPVIVHDGSFSHFKIKENNWAKEVIPYDDMKEAIQHVSTENKGIILWNSMSLKWLIQKYHTDNLEIVPIDFPYGEYKFFSNDEHLLAQLDSVYSSLRANDKLTAIQNKWFYPERHESGIPQWIWQLIQFVTLLALAIAAYYIFFKIRERKMTKRIEKENERLSLIMKTSNVQFLTYNVSTQYFVTMDAVGNAEREYSLLEYSHRFDPSDFSVLTDALRNVIEGKLHNITINLKEYDSDLIHSHNYTCTISVLRRDKHKQHPTILIISKTDTSHDRLRHAQIKETMMRYQSLFNSAMVDMVYYDADGYISDMNAKSLGFMPESIETIREMRIHLRDVLGIHDLDIEQLDFFYTTQLYTSKDDDRILNKILQREKLYYELQIIPIHDKYGNRIGFYGSGRNVTESADSYAKLKQNTHELQIAKDDVTSYVQNIDYVLSAGGVSLAKYHIDTHTLTIYSEIGHEKYALTQTRALTFVDKSSEKNALRILNKMDNAQSENLKTEIKTSVRRKDGLSLYLQINFIPTYKNNEIVEYFGLIRDISDIKAVEEKLTQESIRAQEVETVKNAFLHNMSHEIRTPLNTVVGFSELFEMEHSPEDEAVFINEIKENSASLLKLINDILFLSRLDAGMITLSPLPIDFASIFGGRCSSVWDNHKQPGVEYIVQSPYNRLVVEIDEPNISLIINKILTNAIQHTTQGSVLARYEYIGDQLLISVEDTGSGIKAENIENIFGRFVTGANNGAGLGLSICHELINYMGGKIELTSTEGKGTTIWFSVPCKMIEMERK